MSLLKKLQIGNNEIGKYTQDYLLLDYQCHTSRHHNDLRPEADKFCERIDMTIVAPGRENVHLYQWFISQANLSRAGYSSNCRQMPRRTRRKKRSALKMPSFTHSKRSFILTQTESVN